ncbi:hypothetical protein TYRP_017404 [Tyrophagus putrescentiae]|nr:hypothetical protein TYRP_017404 [Tyrophagus putrescentiae]
MMIGGGGGGGGEQSFITTTTVSDASTFHSSQVTRRSEESRDVEVLFFAIYALQCSDSSWLHLLPIKVHLVQPGAQSGVRSTASAILPPLAPSRLFLPSSQCDSGAIGVAIIGFLFPAFLPCQQFGPFGGC